MPQTDSIRLTLRPGTDATPAEIETMTNSLRAELLHLDLDAVRPPEPAPPPAGAKGGGAEVTGVLIASGVLSAATVKAIAGVVVAWIQRSAARSVTLEHGERRLEVSGVSADQLDMLVDGFYRHGARSDDPAGRDDAS